MQELARLKGVFGSIPLAPECRRDIMRRRLDEIDEQLDAWTGDPEEAGPLIVERDEVAREVESLGGNAERRAKVREPLPLDDEPVIALAVGPNWKER